MGVDLPEWRGARYTKAWVTPRPAPTARQLVIQGGFRVDDGHGRRLERHARRLGFHDVRSLLQARCDSGHSVPSLAEELGVSRWTITKAMATLGIRLAPRRQRLALQRRRHDNQRVAVRVVQLGFPDLHAYVTDRLLHREWPQAAVAAELGTHPARLRGTVALSDHPVPLPPLRCSNAADHGNDRAIRDLLDAVRMRTASTSLGSASAVRLNATVPPSSTLKPGRCCVALATDPS